MGVSEPVLRRVVACCQAFRRSVCPGAFRFWLRALGLLAGRGGAGADLDRRSVRRLRGSWAFAGLLAEPGPVPWPLACWRPASRAGASRASWAAVADLGRSWGRCCRCSIFSICFSTVPGVSCGINGAGCVGSGFGAIWPGAPGRGNRVFPAYTPLFNFFRGTLLPLKIFLLNYFSFFSGGILLPCASTFSERLFFPPRPPPLPMRTILPPSAICSNAGRTQFQHIFVLPPPAHRSRLCVGTGNGIGIGNGKRKRQHRRAAPE